MTAAGAATAGLGLWCGRTFGESSPRRSQELPQQHAWRDFRDMFGLFWSLRLAERFNIDAERSGWSERLGFNGFVAARDHATEADAAGFAPLAEPSSAPVRQTLANLLRRFTSPDWLEQRWPADPPASP